MTLSELEGHFSCLTFKIPVTLRNIAHSNYDVYKHKSESALGL